MTDSYSALWALFFLGETMKGIKHTIEDCKELAKKKGGEFLSTEYKNALTKYTWKCDKGHTWEAISNSIKNGSWCPTCAGHFRYTIIDMQEFASKRGGKCLSKKYVDSDTKLEWECHLGHRWYQSLNRVRKGTWCAKCGHLKRRLTLEEFQDIAIARGGKCISTEYENCDKKLKFECHKGHIWFAKPQHVKTGCWCPKCAQKKHHDDKKQRYIKRLHKLAEEKGGKFLENETTKCRDKGKFKCSQGHIFFIKITQFTHSNQWCPYCFRKYKTEEKCRHIFEQLTGKVFQRTNSILEDNLQLDGYNKELNVAFEYQGEQHFKFVKYWHKTEERFKIAQQRDILKTELCKKFKINKIDVTYLVAQNSDKYLIGFIRKELNKLNVPIKKIIRMKEFYKNSPVLNRLKKLAESKGGKLLSSNYVNGKTKLKWQCKEGHIWKTKPGNIKVSWCPQCSNERMRQNYLKCKFEDIEQITKDKKGKCLSSKSEYVNQNSYLEFQCEKGHVWKTKASYIYHGSWCRICVLYARNHKIVYTKP